MTEESEEEGPDNTKKPISTDRCAMPKAQNHRGTQRQSPSKVSTQASKVDQDPEAVVVTATKSTQQAGSDVDDGTNHVKDKAEESHLPIEHRPEGYKDKQRGTRDAQAKQRGVPRTVDNLENSAENMDSVNIVHANYQSSDSAAQAFSEGQSPCAQLSQTHMDFHSQNPGKFAAATSGDSIRRGDQVFALVSGNISLSTQVVKEAPTIAATSSAGQCQRESLDLSKNPGFTNQEFLLILRMSEQATINRLVTFRSNELVDEGMKTLNTLPSEQNTGLGPVAIKLASINVNGNVELIIQCTRTFNRDRLTILQDTWASRFETSVCPPIHHNGIYSVKMSQSAPWNLDFDTRRGKALSITAIVVENKELKNPPLSVDDFQDTRFLVSHGKSQTATVVIDFRFRTVANQVLDTGLLCTGARRGCAMLDRHPVTLKCGRCQGLDHSTKGCTRPWRCGKCSEHHPTSECATNIHRCAHCDGPHAARFKYCPAKLAMKKLFHFEPPDAPQSGPIDHHSASRSYQMRQPQSQPSRETHLYPSRLIQPAEHPHIKTEEEVSIHQLVPTTYGTFDDGGLQAEVQHLRAELERLESKIQNSDALKRKRDGGPSLQEDQVVDHEKALKRARMEKQPADRYGPCRQASPYQENRTWMNT